jgi:hypothetical protein
MGYAVMMFGVLLIMSVVLVTTYNYGIMKGSQTAPLKAENDYAARETGKAQTSLTILNTCIWPESGNDRYVNRLGNELSGIYSFNLTVINNGSIVLNSSKTTIIYLSRNTSNKTVISNVGFPKTPKNVWAPLTNASLNISGNIINTPTQFGDTYGPSTNPWDELRILVAAENGVVTIPPTSPINFTGILNTSAIIITFRWNASYDKDGIAYYSLYIFDGFPDSPPASGFYTGFCPPRPYTIIQIPGNATSYSWDYSTSPYLQNTDCYGSEDLCHDGFYLTAVDNLGNEGIPSRTLDCHTDRGNNYICYNHQ